MAAMPPDDKDELPAVLSVGFALMYPPVVLLVRTLPEEEKKREGRRAYDPHAHRTTASTNHKEVSPSKTVDEIEQPDKRQDSLHDTKDASSQERSIPTRDSN